MEYMVLKSIDFIEFQKTVFWYFYTKRIPHDLGEGVTRFENRIFWVGWRQD